MDEAELAMVVACAHSIKDCAFDLDAEGGAFRLDDLKFSLETAGVTEILGYSHQSPTAIR